MLRRDGFVIGRRQFFTLMRRMGLKAIYCKPRTSDKQPGHKIFPYLLRDVVNERVNQVWELDTNYVPMATGCVYLIYLKAYDSVAEARHCIGRFIDWYNDGRPHSSVNGRPPMDAYQALMQAIKLAA